jgi:hypothetical protein
MRLELHNTAAQGKPESGPKFRLCTWRANLDQAGRPIALAMMVFAGLGYALAQQTAVPSLSISPSTIRMSTFYEGTKVRIEGTAPAGAQVLVVVRGDEKDEFFNKKGRVGPVWVNTDKVHIAHVPCLFLVFGSQDVNAVLDRASIDRYELDTSAIRNRLLCRSHCKCSASHAGSVLAKCKGTVPDAADQELIRNSYISLKTHDGSYQTHPNAIDVASSSDGTHYELNLDWPKEGAPGSYQIEVLACQNHSVVARSTAQLDVVEVGFPAQMAALATTRSLFYAALAVLAAFLAGFATDMLTSRFRKPRLKARKGGPPHLGPGKKAEEVRDVMPLHH